MIRRKAIDITGGKVARCGDSNYRVRRCLLLPAASLLALVVALASTAVAAAAWTIEHPYAKVDWKNDRQYKANLHTHTTRSDGSAAPEEVIDRYHKLGYSILALTDHDTIGPGGDAGDPQRHKTTWPWESFGRDPESLGMVAIEGNELSRRHHTGSFFTDYGAPTIESEEEALEEIGRRGGLAVLFHPGRYNRSIEWYAAMFRKYPHLIGIEVYNQGDRYPGDRDTWDAIFTEVAADRPVWAFSNDDMHNPKSHLGRNWNVLVLPELSKEAVREGLEEGRFFFVYAPQGHEGPSPPAIESISVDAEKGTIAIDASGYQEIAWISDGNVVHRGDRVRLGELDELGGYIRAVVHGKQGDCLLGTQPFRVRSRED